MSIIKSHLKAKKFESPKVISTQLCFICKDLFEETSSKFEKIEYWYDKICVTYSIYLKVLSSIAYVRIMWIIEHLFIISHTSHISFIILLFIRLHTVH